MKFPKPPITPKSQFHLNSRKMETYNQIKLSRSLNRRIRHTPTLPIDNLKSNHTIEEEEFQTTMPQLKSSSPKRGGSHPPKNAHSLEQALANFLKNSDNIETKTVERKFSKKPKSKKVNTKLKLALPPAFNLPKIDQVSTPTEMSCKGDFENLDTNREIRKMLHSQVRVIKNKTIVRETKSSLIRKRIAQENKKKAISEEKDVGFRYRNKLNSRILVLNKRCNDEMKKSTKLHKFVCKIEVIVNKSYGNLHKLIKKSEKEKKQKLTLKDGLLIQLQNKTANIGLGHFSSHNTRNSNKVSVRVRSHDVANNRYSNFDR
ncbi:unnamed protein product [Moneuplotes crassus]|uniref:Uncharacterized protein n=1 Tax=Euplotes crassus TaxID=5936 RepID=A0AAD1XAP7_EUPCR|nr:unnamed protein product [Moneuplotes crassus]